MGHLNFLVLAFALSVTATVNGSAVVFLIDSGSTLTMLHKDTWERCKGGQQKLEPWRLIGAEGSQLEVFVLLK